MPDQEKTEDCGVKGFDVVVTSVNASGVITGRETVNGLRHFLTMAERKAADLDGNPHPLTPQPLRVCHPDGTIQELPLPTRERDKASAALMRILGDQPLPNEDPWERCRRIAAEALGYPAPKPLLNTSIKVVTEDVLSQRNWAWERIRYLEARLAEKDKHNAEQCHALASMLLEARARIAELEAKRPPAPVDPSPPPAIFAAIHQGKP